MDGRATTEVRRAYEGLGPARAFLPAAVPGTSVSDPLARFTAAASDLPARYPRHCGGVRGWLEDLFALEDQADAPAVAAASESDLECLAAALAVLVHAYRWDTAPPSDERFDETTLTFPPGLWATWRHVTQRLGQPPVGTLYNQHTSNWTSRTCAAGSPYDPRDLTLSDLRLAFNWLEGDAASDLEVFALAFVLVEAKGATALSGAVRLAEAAGRRDGVEAAHALDELLEGIDDMTSSFLGTIRASQLNPRRWFEHVQAHAGWALEIDGEVLAGASGLQTGALRAVDAVLGIGAAGQLGMAYADMRRYLLPRHRRFLDALDSAAPAITEARGQWGRLATRRYDECARSMQRLRRAHRARGAQYLRAGEAEDGRRLTTGRGVDLRSNQPAVEQFEADMGERIDVLAKVLTESGPQDEGTAEEAFRFLSPEERSRLFATRSVRALRPGEALVDSGETPTSLWIISDGVLEARDGNGTRVGRMWPGQVVGELSLLDPRPAEVTLRAEVDAELVEVSHRAVLDAIALDDDLARRFYQSLGVAIAAKLRAVNEVVAELAASDRQAASEPRGPSAFEGARTRNNQRGAG